MIFSDSPPPNSMHIITIGHYWQLAHTIVFAIALLASGILHQLPDIQSVEVIGIVLSCITTPTLIVTTQLTLRKFSYDWKQSSLLSRCKSAYVSACAVTLFFTIVSLDFLCRDGSSEKRIRFQINIYFANNIASIVLYYVLIYPIKSKCKLNYKTSHIIICLAVYLIIVGAVFVWKEPSEMEYNWVLTLFGCTYSVSLLFCMLPLMSIATNQIELMVKDEDTDSLLKPIEDLDTRTDSESKDNVEKVKCRAVEETSSGEIQKTFSNSPPPNSIHIITIGHYWQLAHTIVFAITSLASGALDPILDSQGLERKQVKLIFMINGLILMQIIMHSFEYELSNTPLLKKCERSYTIGCAGILFYTIIPLTLFCFCGSAMANISIYFTSNIASIVLYYTFICPIKNKCKLNYKTSHIIICLAVYLFTVGPSLIWRNVSIEEFDWIPVFVGSTYSASMLFCMVTLMSIAKSKLELTVKDDGCHGVEKMLTKISKFVSYLKSPFRSWKATDQESKDGKDEVKCSAIDKTSSGEIQKKPIEVECDMCMQKFDASIENRIPRILTNCGHSMCHECIQQTLADSNHQTISCPFCQKETTVDGGNAENLPKNFAIVKII